MSTPARSAEPAPRAAEARLAAALVVLGAWTAVVPYLARPLGLGVDVAGGVEVVDHVVPGAVLVAVAGWLTLRSRRELLAGRAPALVGGGLCFLAGFWVLATHVPLLADAARGQEGWGAALWHSSAALPVVLVSLWLVLRSSPRSR